MTFFTFEPSLPLRRMLVWLLALLLPLQGLAAGVQTARGPAHVHKPLLAKPADTQTAAILSAFRRGVPTHDGQPTHSAGHGHDMSHATERHHHAGDDGSVLRQGGAASADDEAGAAGTSAPSFLALLPSALAWQPPADGAAKVSGETWPALTCDPIPLERPPQSS